MLIHSYGHACMHWNPPIDKPFSKCWEYFKNKLNLISCPQIHYDLKEDNIHYVQLSTFQNGDDKYPKHGWEKNFGKCMLWLGHLSQAAIASSLAVDGKEIDKENLPREGDIFLLYPE